MLETSFDRDRLLAVVVKAVAEVVPDSCLISLRADDAEPLSPVCAWDEDPEVRKTLSTLFGTSHAARDALLAQLGDSAEPLFVPELDLHALGPRLAPEALAVLKQIGARGLMVFPLRGRGRGQLIGLLSVIRHDPARPALDALDREIVEHLANHTALTLANERLFREQQSLAAELESSRFLDAVIENIPDMVFVKDADELRFVRFNRAGEELLGIPREQLLGKNDYDFFPRSEADFFTAKDQETLQARALVEIVEEPIQTRSGQRWLHTKKVPILDAQGTPRFLLGISENITDRKQTVVALRAAIARAESANRELEAFSYSVAHDLRSPLRAIDGFSEALLDDYGPAIDAMGRSYLDRIRAAAQRMGTLIDDLLRLSRVTRTELKPEPVNLSELARATVGQLERLDPRHHVEVEIADGITATGDPKLLSIVFDNLLGNAWKFSGKAPRPHVEFGEEHRAKNGSTYFVRDNGAGFDMTHKDKLFGTFQRLHREDDFPGTGVGLATVKRIIERHGGQVWAEAAVGKGATFFFTLGEPAVSPAAAAG
jgi:PAS domain S-box-containing protein